jgi:short-subunit dehydrogenase
VSLYPVSAFGRIWRILKDDLLVPFQATFKEQPVNDRSVLLTGASSGIGRALALAYASEGVTLALAGRDVARLETVAAACRAKGAGVSTTRLDVRDALATAEWVTQADAHAPIDLAFVNAGIGAGLEETAADFGPTRTILEVNVLGALNTLEAVTARMRPRRRGRIVLMGSLAALRGIPGSQGYSASKAAIKALAEGLRPQLAQDGIGLCLVMPGFVRTPMNEDKGFPTPLRIEPERAAEIIRRGVARGRPRIAFPLPLVWGTRLLALVPSLADALAMRAARRGGTGA